MKLSARNAIGLVTGDAQAERAVPPTGFTANLTLFAAGSMAFLAVFALALSLTTGRIAERWSEELARTSTLRISASEGQLEIQTQAALEALRTTPGVREARAFTADEQRVLLEPWFGPDLPIETLPVPQLIEIIEEGDGYDAEGLKLRLAAEAPGAILDDHTRWRRPLVEAAGRLRGMGLISLILIAVTTAAMITLAAQAALAANQSVIRVLRLVGAQDSYIARAFVRRFTLRAFFGALIGTFVGVIAVMLLPSDATEGGFISGLGFERRQWIWPASVPFLAALVAFVATRMAALRVLKGLM